MPFTPPKPELLQFPKQVSYLSGVAHAVPTAWNTLPCPYPPMAGLPTKLHSHLPVTPQFPVQPCLICYSSHTTSLVLSLHGSARSPSSRAQSVSCPFCVPGVLCEQVLGLSAERIGQWLLEESWVRPAGVWPEGPLVESLGCGEETRAVARNLGQGLRSGESRPCSPVGG